MKYILHYSDYPGFAALGLARLRCLEEVVVRDKLMTWEFLYILDFMPQLAWIRQLLVV
jgi:hypothetical protein